MNRDRIQYPAHIQPMSPIGPEKWREDAYHDARARLESQKESIVPALICLGVAMLGGFVLGMMV